MLSFICLCSLLEMGGVGLIVPFVSVISDPEIIHRNLILGKLYHYVNAESPKEFLIFMGLGLMGFYIIKNLSLGLMNYAQSRFIFSRRAEMGRKVFSMYVNRPYSFHLERNRAELLRNIDFSVTRVFGAVQAVLKLCSESLVVGSIIVMLIVVNPVIIIGSFLLLGILCGIFYRLTEKRILSYGEVIQATQKRVGKAVLEGFGAIKEVKIAGIEGYFPQHYFKYMMENARANWMQATFNQMPRYFLEVIAIGSIIFIIILVQVQGGQLKTLLPTLSLFAMASIRIMPSLSQIVMNLQILKFNSPAVDILFMDIVDLEAFVQSGQDTKPTLKEPLSIESSINIQNLSYRYPGTSDDSLKNINLAIKKGEAVAFVGPSGAGKTTLANVLLGLLKPDTGEVLADKINVFDKLNAWQNCLGYVPQSIYLLDDTVRRNIAFGIKDSLIDENRVKEALYTAQLSGFINKLQDGLETIEVDDETVLPGLVANVAKEKEAEKIIVGLPLNMNGSESLQTKKVRVFASELEKKCSMPVVFWDERMTSLQAKRIMREMEKKTYGNKHHIDRISATLILQDYMKTIV